jgi:DNA-binding NarL/FixJ family response regulator
MTVPLYLSQGKASKIILHEFAMTERTIRVHLRDIVRKTGAICRSAAGIAGAVRVREHGEANA